MTSGTTLNSSQPSTPPASSSSIWSSPAGPRPHVRPAAGLEWHYEMRREAQLIVPGLYLGPFQAATKLAKMQEMGITHVVCVRDKKEKGLIFPRFPNHFEHYILEISDNPDQNIIRLIPDCLRFIDEAITAGGTVLAYCNGGIALSPAIVVPYLMVKFDWSLRHALDYVQSKRYCVSPTNFTTQLKEYEPIYRAMKALQTGGAEVLRQERQKRELEDDSDEEDGDDDAGRRRTRGPWTDETMDLC